MFLGLWGSYGKNDSVDVQYRVGGRGTRWRPAWRSSARAVIPVKRPALGTV